MLNAFLYTIIGADDSTDHHEFYLLPQHGTVHCLWVHVDSYVGFVPSCEGETTIYNIQQFYV